MRLVLLGLLAGYVLHRLTERTEAEPGQVLTVDDERLAQVAIPSG